MQTNIFGEVETYRLTIEQAAKTANVSTATIRNWIKTGYLIQAGKGLVSQDSLEKFMSEVAGKEKLNARANKLLKDEHDHHEVSDKVGQLIAQHKGEEIGIEYENSLSDSHRNKEGIYYTPSWVVEDMYKHIEIKPGFKFFDPCCGSGNFLIEAIRHGVAPENVYGFDTDENAVLIARQRIKDEFGFDTDKVKVGDFLQEAFKMSEDKIAYDLIFTNPPWGKKIEKSVKACYSAMYGCGNSLDTTALFLGASLSVLKPDGRLGFLIQEAFFNISTFEDIRRKILSNKILRFVDYGKAFKGLMTKAQAIVMANKPAHPLDLVECCVEKSTFTRTLASFRENPKRIFNFWTTEPESQVINQLYAVQHITLKDKANWALGIVTGKTIGFALRNPGRATSQFTKGLTLQRTD